jgi:two-component system cell cycle response regulator DivK
VIILSIADQKQVGFALGATDYLVKPIRKPLRESIEKHLGQHKNDASVVLLVEDDSETLALLEEVLRSGGYETESVRNGCDGTGSIVFQTGGSGLTRPVDAGDGWLSGNPARRQERKPAPVADLRDDGQKFDCRGNDRAEPGDPGPIPKKWFVAATAHPGSGQGNQIRELLEIRDYEVFEAGDGQQALEKISQARPHILPLDLGMPVLDGYRTIARIREISELRSLPVLAITAYAMHGDREKILAAGFDGYVSKPIHSKFFRRA